VEGYFRDHFILRMLLTRECIDFLSVFML